jgi:hypothetical protein
MSQLENTLFSRLEQSGIGRPLVPGFLRNLANAHDAHFPMSHAQVQAQLRYLGWNDIELDYHTWQLAEAYLGTKM